MIVSTLCLLSAFSGVTAAAGFATAKVKNLCMTPVHLWSVDTETYGPYTINPYAEYTEYIHWNDQTGVAIKISPNETSLETESPLLLLQYAAEPPHLWLNLHAINGHPFEGRPLSVHGCGSEITWPTGIEFQDPEGTGNATVKCQYGQSTVLVLCGLQYEGCNSKPEKVGSKLR